jgi:hypothetical protein
MTVGGMNMSTKNAVYWLYMAGCCAYIGYEWYSYTGLFRLAAEWQMDTFGSYSVKLTLIGLAIALLIPAAVVAKLLGLELRGLEPKAPALSLSPGVVLLAGLALAAVAAGAGWLAYGKVTAEVAFDAFDLSKNKAPPSTHVVMSGIAHTEYQVEFETKRSGSTSVDRYFPITAADWRRGDPLVYFVKTNATAYMPPEGGTSFTFSRRTPPFPMTVQPSTLVENGLPGAVAEVYRKNNVALATAPVVLDSPGADATPYFFVAILGGLGSIYGLSAAAMMAFRRRRLTHA